MICALCEKECPESDFYNSVGCYKCVYRLKIGKKKKEYKKCVICDGPLPNAHKFSYCSDECANKGYTLRRQESWAKKYQAIP